MSARFRTYDRWDLGLFLFALIGTFVSLSLAVGLATVSLVALIDGDSLGAQSAQAASAGVFTLALMGAPAIYQSGRAIIGRGSPAASRPNGWWLAISCLFPLGLVLGYLAYHQSILSYFLGPLGQVLAVAAPAAALIVLVRRAGPPIRPRRAWGHFLLGLWAVPAMALVVEGFLLLATVLAAGLGLSFSSSGRELIGRLQLVTEMADPTLAPDLMAEIAFRPSVIVSVTILLTLLVPLAEESLKTAAVWPLLPGGIRGDEAFLGGALGGAGFALAEGLFLAPPATGWLLTATARAGATLMHATATGIAAWAIAEAVVRRRWSRAAAGLLAAISLHGLWNAGAVAIGLSQLALEAEVEAASTTFLAIRSAGVALILALSLLAYWLLRSFQRRLASGDAGAANSGQQA